MSNFTLIKPRLTTDDMPYYEFAQDAKATAETAPPKPDSKAPAAKAAAASTVPAKGVKVSTNATTGELSVESGDQVNTETVIEAAKQMAGKVPDMQNAMKTSELQKVATEKMQEVVEKKNIETTEKKEQEAKLKEKVDTAKADAQKLKDDAKAKVDAKEK